MDLELKSTHEGELHLNNVKINVAILNNHIRVISEHSLYKIFGKRNTNNTEQKLSISFIDYDIFSHLIKLELKSLLKPITFIKKDNTTSIGFNAKVIFEIAKLYTHKKAPKKLPKSQLIIRENSNNLLNIFNYKTIDHLINHNVNFDYKEEQKEILTLLKNTYSEFLTEFKDELTLFFIELFRLNNWDFTPKQIQKRPTVLHQWLETILFYDNTPNNAYKPIFKNNITQVITLFNVSKTMEDFWNSYSKLNLDITPKAPYYFDETGFTKEPIEMLHLSEFNKKLFLLLNNQFKK